MKKIVILGGGYGGVNAAITLDKKLKASQDVEIILINKNKNHIMLTSLHEVAGGRVGKEAVQVPLHEIFRSGKVRLVIDEAVSVDFDLHQIICRSGDKIRYDYLIFSTGSRPAYFNIEGARENSLSLWSLQDALAIRHYVLHCFQEASQLRDEKMRRSKLSFLVAGGGFTGVELAGELGEWKDLLCRSYGIDKAEVSIKLIEAFPRILMNLDGSLILKAVSRLNQLGIEVLTASRIVRVDEKYVHLLGGLCLEGKLIWCAGIEGNKLNEKLAFSADKKFRMEVDEYLRAKKYDRIYGVGDAVYFEENGSTIPQTVETALQTSAVAADNILAEIENREKIRFKTNYHGTMVSLGNRYGVAKIMNFSLSGKAALLMKHLVNIHYYIGLGSLGLAGKYIKTQFFTTHYRQFKDSTDIPGCMEK